MKDAEQEAGGGSGEGLVRFYRGEESDGWDACDKWNGTGDAQLIGDELDASLVAELAQALELIR